MTGTESEADQQEYYDAFKIKLVQDGKLDASTELYKETTNQLKSIIQNKVSVKAQQKVTQYDKEYEAENQDLKGNAVNNVDGNVGVTRFHGFNCRTNA